MAAKRETQVPLAGALIIVIAAFLAITSAAPEQKSAPRVAENRFDAARAEAAGEIASSAPPTSLGDIAEMVESAVSSIPILTQSSPSPEEKPEEELPAPTPSQQAAAVVRTPDLYDVPPQSFQTVSENARLALVNILCVPQDSSMHASSGSGAIIDSRGVILTNAHVAQYVLLAQSGRTNLSCYVRTGAPAHIIGSAEVLFIPPVWVRENAADITDSSPIGTGEHDYALLRITSSREARRPLPHDFPSLPIDPREGVGFPPDSVLAASYPSEFVGAAATTYSLYPASSITTIRRLLTFDESSVDLLSLAGVQEAQSGSSGGAIANAWGYLIGIITSVSEGATTVEREMRALSLSYIELDLHRQTGKDIEAFLAAELPALALDFKNTEEHALVELLIGEIEKKYLR